MVDQTKLLLNKDLHETEKLAQDRDAGKKSHNNLLMKGIATFFCRTEDRRNGLLSGITIQLQSTATK